MKNEECFARRSLGVGGKNEECFARRELMLRGEE